MCVFLCNSLNHLHSVTDFKLTFRNLLCPLVRTTDFIMTTICLMSLSMHNRLGITYLSKFTTLGNGLILHFKTFVSKTYIIYSFEINSQFSVNNR